MPSGRLIVVMALVTSTGAAHAQNRGVYPLGMSALNSGATAAPGFTYVNQLLSYARDRAKDDDGHTVASGSNTVVMDMNTLAWVSGVHVLGAAFSMSATIPVAKNSLTSDLQGAISGGSGLADSYYLPAILGWSHETLGVRAMYGFLAPTGKFEAGAADNVGSGYWTHTLSSGQTWRPAGAPRLSVSAFEMIEWHTRQKGTDVQPGDTFDLDWSAMGALGGSEAVRWQAGVAGYEARQTSAKTGPAITPAQEDERYAVNAIGFAVATAFPKHRASAGLKVFSEFANRSTYEGWSVQLQGAVSF
jgi:hypothetical protein